jgi:hypothetical protein
MRSTLRDHPSLPLEVQPALVGTGRPARPPARTGALVHRLGSDALASHGMPAGTQVVLDPERPPRRGHVLFVRVQGRLKVGIFEVELGRAVLRSDTESFWLDHTVEVCGVATVADAPLDGMPR